MLRLDRTDRYPAAYIEVVKEWKVRKPVIKKTCNVHGSTTFILDEHHAKLCNEKYQKIPNIIAIQYSCLRCLSEIEQKSSYTLLREAHSRELRRIFGDSCVNCRYNEHSDILEFHHVFPEDKKGNISDYKSFDTKFKEAQKCILLCPTCHSLADREKIDKETIAELFYIQYTTAKQALGGDEDLGDMKEVLKKLGIPLEEDNAEQAEEDAEEVDG